MRVVDAQRQGQHPPAGHGPERLEHLSPSLRDVQTGAPTSGSLCSSHTSRASASGQSGGEAQLKCRDRPGALSHPERGRGDDTGRSPVGLLARGAGERPSITLVNIARGFSYGAHRPRGGPVRRGFLRIVSASPHGGSPPSIAVGAPREEARREQGEHDGRGPRASDRAQNGDDQARERRENRESGVGHLARQPLTRSSAQPARGHPERAGAPGSGLPRPPGCAWRRARRGTGRSP